MRPRRFLFAVVALLAAMFGGLTARQWTETARLRTEAARLHAARAELVYLRAAHEHLTAARPDDAELARLLQSGAEAERLHAEAAALRARPSSSPAAARKTTSSQSKPSQLPATTWRDLGRETPAATLESVLSTSARGEVQALAGLLAFEPGTLAKIEEVYAALPEENRAAHGSPVEVFATLVASRIPLDLAQTEIVEATSSSGETIVRMRLRNSGGTTREATFRLQQDSGGWRLIVPARVVDAHLRMLTDRGGSNASR